MPLAVGTDAPAFTVKDIMAKQFHYLIFVGKTVVCIST